MAVTNKITVFYSWQSDNPQNATYVRNFIENSLRRAAKIVRKDGSIAVEPVVDRDTGGVDGSPDIIKTILEKIERCQLFVADITIINSASKFRKSPNPNVLFELGYAVKTLGWHRIVLVMNEAFGRREHLPFDLDKRRLVMFKHNANTNKSQVMKDLTSRLEVHIRRAASTESGDIVPVPAENVELTNSERAKQIRERKEFNSFRTNWRNTPQGFVDTKNSAIRIMDMLMEAWSKDQEAYDSIGFTASRAPRDIMPLVYFRYQGLLKMTVEFKSDGIDRIRNHQIIVETLRPPEINPSKVTTIYRPDISATREVVWYRDVADDNSYTEERFVRERFREFMLDIELIETGNFPQPDLKPRIDTFRF